MAHSQGPHRHITHEEDRASRTAPVSRRPARCSSPRGRIRPRQAQLNPPPEVWQKHIEDVYPNRLQQTYFLPPLFFKRVPHEFVDFCGERIRKISSSCCLASSPKMSRRMKEKLNKEEQMANHQSPQVAGAMYVDPDVRLQKVQDSDLQDTCAQQWILHHLEELVGKTKEVMMVISDLKFMKYLCVSSVPHAPSKPPAKELDQSFCQGDFDLLIIHRLVGFIVGEIKSITRTRKMSEDDFLKKVAKKVEEAIVQINKDEHALVKWTKDLKGIKITKILILPNVSREQLNQVFQKHPETYKNLQRCLGIAGIADALSHCMLSDMLSTQNKDWKVEEQAMDNLVKWWTRLVDRDRCCAHMNDTSYDVLLSRFCGPATAVEIPTVTAPHKVIKTLGGSVAETGLQFAVLALYPSQLHILCSSEQKVFITGAPGTGKSIVLALKAKQWWSEGKEVQIVSIQGRGRAVSFLLEKQVLSCRRPPPSDCPLDPNKVRRHSYCFESSESDVDRAVEELAARAVDGQLYIIVDEVGQHYRDRFQSFCSKLMAKEEVDDLYIWAASWRSHSIPSCFREERVNTMLRCPPMVHREVKQSEMIGVDCQPYSEEAHAPTKGPSIIWLFHRGKKGHAEGEARDCPQCGREIAELIKDKLGIREDSQAASGSRSSVTDEPRCQYRDVLIIYYDPDDDKKPPPVTSKPLFVEGLREASVPFRVLRKHDPDDAYKEIAQAKSNAVTVTHSENVSGLERRVVVGIQGDVSGFDRFFSMSRCTAQLIWVCDDDRDDDAGVT